MAKEIKTLNTKRLLLRGIDETDAETIVKLRSEPSVFQYFKSPHRITLEEHLNWFNQTYQTDHNRYDWICIERASGKRIGVFGIYHSGRQAEVNYLLAPESQHRGYAAEAIRELMKYASDDLQCNQVIAEIHEENEPSIKLAERLGFRMQSFMKPFAVYGIEVEKIDSDQNGCE